MAATVPFVASFRPSARAQALGAPVEVDISKVEPGALLRVESRGRVIMIMHRTAEMLGQLVTIEDDLADPTSVESEQPSNVAAVAQHTGAGALQMDPANTDVGDLASLQRGAKYFVNFCLGCHSAQYVRYNRLGADLELTEEQLIESIMFTGERPFDTMTKAMTDEDTARWFGVAPPDLSLIARSRGTDYLYNFLRGFYEDDAALSGANNL